MNLKEIIPSFKPATIILCFCVIFSCSRNEKLNDAKIISNNKFMYDTLFIETNIPGNDIKSDSVSSNYSFRIIQVPKTTKVVKWFSVGYMPNGGGLLTVTTEDEQTYKVPLPNSTVVAAIGNLLQNSYVRYDTLSTELFSYKNTNSSRVNEALLKPF